MNTRPAVRRPGAAGIAMRAGAAACLAASLAGGNMASAQSAATFPLKPIRFVVPFTPGSASDILGRTVGEKLAASWGQPVNVENRPGQGASSPPGRSPRPSRMATP